MKSEKKKSKNPPAMVHYPQGNKKNADVGFFKFLFGIKNSIGNVYLFLGIFILLIYSVVSLISEVFYGICINFIQSKQMDELKIYCLILGLTGIAYFFLFIICGAFMKKHSEYLCKNFKVNYYSLIFKQDFGWFNSQDLNKLSESIKTSYEKLQNGTGRKLFYFLKYIIYTIMVFVYFLLISWKITLAIIPIFILIILASKYYEQRMDRISENNRNFNQSLAGYIRELIGKYKTLVSFGNFDHEKNLFKSLLQKNYNANTNFSFMSYLVSNSISFLNFCVNGIVIIFGAFLIRESLGSTAANNAITTTTTTHNNIFNNFFDLKTGQVLSIILTVFSLIIYMREILVSLKDYSDLYKSMKHYFDLESQDKNLAIYHADANKQLAIGNTKDIKGNRNESGEYNKTVKFREIKFVEVSFDYENLFGNKQTSNRFSDNNENEVQLQVQTSEVKEENDSNKQQQKLNKLDNPNIRSPEENKKSDNQKINSNNHLSTNPKSKIPSQNLTTKPNTKYKEDDEDINNYEFSSPKKTFKKLDIDKVILLLSPARQRKKTFLDLQTQQKHNPPIEKDNDNKDLESSLDLKKFSEKMQLYSPVRKKRQHKSSRIAINKHISNNINCNSNNIINKQLGENIVTKDHVTTNGIKSSIFNAAKKDRRDTLSSNKDQNNRQINDKLENDVKINDEMCLNYIVNIEDNLTDKKFSLEKINISFESGRINYLIGKSGSGKTSVLSLILKLFRPTGGKILINNEIDLNELTNDEYSSFIGYVPQESLFYDLTVKDNIKFFQDDIPDEKITEVVKFLKMDKFVSKLKYGIDTKIGPNGSALSGGQRQLISIARALVKNPKILLLDEFTSNFDNILTKEIFSLLNRISPDTIVIVVTHNLKIVDFNNKMNKIIYLEKGKIKDINNENFQHEIDNSILNSEQNSDFAYAPSSNNSSDMKNNDSINNFNLVEIYPQHKNKQEEDEEGKDEESIYVIKNKNNIESSCNEISSGSLKRKESLINKSREFYPSNEAEHMQINIQQITKNNKNILSILTLNEKKDDKKSDLPYANDQNNPNISINNINKNQDTAAYKESAIKQKIIPVIANGRIDSNENFQEEDDYEIPNSTERLDRDGVETYPVAITATALNSKEAVMNMSATNSNEMQSNAMKPNFLLNFIKKNKKNFILIIIFYVINSLILTSYGLLFYFISTKLYSTDKDELAIYGSVLGVVSFILGGIYTLVQALQMLYIDNLSNRLIYFLRKKLFTWFLRINTAVLSDNNKNEMINLFTDHIITSGQVFGIILSLSIEISFTFISSFVMSLIFDWRLGLICTSFIIILMVNMLIYYYFSSKLEVDKVTNDYFSETIANIKLIKAFNLKENLLKFLIAEESKLRTKGTATNHMLHYIGSASYYIIVYIELALLNYLGGVFVIEQGVSTIGSFTGSTSLLFIYLMIDLLMMKYINDFYFIKQSLEKLINIINSDNENIKEHKINKNKELENKEKLTQTNPQTPYYAAAAYEQVNKGYPQIQTPQPLLKLEDIAISNNSNKKNISGKIEFKNVSFSYSTEKNKQKVLNNLSFVINPGTKAGFVGPSGCGKSTILQLLLRFYEPSEGNIFLDDQNIKDYDLRELRDLFSGVFQEPDLFERSIYENIQYGNLNASDEEIAAAALMAQIPLSLLNDKSNQSIAQISGGQKQRIAIARCILKQREIYFFDEATSALDINTEKKILFNLEHYFKDLEGQKTILTVAHRLINIQNADCIFVLKDGQLAEKGDHKTLLKKKGIYRELWEKEKLKK